MKIINIKYEYLNKKELIKIEIYLLIPIIK